MVDEEVKRKWVREAEAMLLFLNPLTARQKAMVEEVAKAPDDMGLLSERLGKVKLHFVAILEQDALDVAGRMLVQAALQSIESVSAAWHEAPPEKSLRAGLDEIAASQRPRKSPLRAALESKQLSMPRPGVHVGPAKIWGPDELAEARARRAFKEALTELAKKRRRP